MTVRDKKVLVIGGGGREQALAWKLLQSPQVGKVFVAPGNGGSHGSIENVDIQWTDVKGLLNFAKEKQIDLTVIGQEAASEAGVVDAFSAAGLTIFGVDQAAVQLESSKVFSKNLMKKAKVPTAAYQTFSDPVKAADYAKSRPLPVVIKADGLAEGKGVVIAETSQQIDEAINEIMVEKKFGQSGAQVVVEDFLKGQEVSTHALCDGRNFVLFPPSQDHKQIYDGDKGPNTGGMGVIAPVPWVSQEQMQTVAEKVIAPTLTELENQNVKFVGCLYPGLMIDNDDVKVLEFNARFGDPEAEVYMRLFDGDLYEVMTACAEGKLDPKQVKWRDEFAVSVVMASAGYPGKYEKGLPITGLDEAAKMPDVVIFHAGTKEAEERGENGEILTNGGRVLNVTATGKTLDEALEKAYKAVDKIHFDGAQFRRDIGRRTK
ncbi:phosphoribosylamine--glycine ligase [Candidatus Saccharibacteria bacterium]|nr:phosphoribosylamine--glycine ligase [Candidatus Saccharibacteria bacterium]